MRVGKLTALSSLVRLLKRDTDEKIVLGEPLGLEDEVVADQPQQCRTTLRLWTSWKSIARTCATLTVVSMVKHLRPSGRR